MEDWRDAGKGWFPDFHMWGSRPSDFETGSEEKEHVSGDDVLQAIVEEIYSDIEKWESWNNIRNTYRMFSIIIDYDTTLQLEGLEGFWKLVTDYIERNLYGRSHILVD